LRALKRNEKGVEIIEVIHIPDDDLLKVAKPDRMYNRTMIR
jgi:hypothetical protein